MNDAAPARRPNPYQAIVTYFAVLLLAALLLMPLLFNGLMFESQLKLGFLLLVALVWWRINSIVFLLTIQVVLLVVEPASTGFNFMGHLLIPLLTVLLVASIDRFRLCRRWVKKRPAEKKIWRRLLPRLPQLNADGSREFPGLDPRLGWPLARLGLIGLIATLIAAIVLLIVPLNERANRVVGLLPNELRMIVLCFVLLVTYLVASVVIGIWIWRKLTPAQSRVYLRGVVANWLEMDIRSVVRRREKLVRKQAKKRNKATRKSTRN